MYAAYACTQTRVKFFVFSTAFLDRGSYRVPFFIGDPCKPHPNPTMGGFRVHPFRIRVTLIKRVKKGEKKYLKTLRVKGKIKKTLTLRVNFEKTAKKRVKNYPNSPLG